MLLRMILAWHGSCKLNASYRLEIQGPFLEGRMAVVIPFLASRRASDVAAEAITASVGELLEDLFSGNKGIAAQASAQLSRLLASQEPSLQELTMEQWERLLFPIKYSDDAVVSSLFGSELQIEILRAVSRGGYDQGVICARFASYRARNRKVRRAGRECVQALEGLREHPAGNLARAIS
jgi:hypothetical protein